MLSLDSTLAARGAILMCLLFCGCTSVKTTNTARSSTEQMLVSNAIDQALNKVDFQAFSGHSVFVEEKYFDCVDKAYLLGSIRHRLIQVGALLMDKVDEAQLVVEPRSGGVGTGDSETFLGIPEITLPGMLTLPEIRMATRSQHVGVAKIGILAYERTTRRPLGIGGVTLAKSDDNNLSIFGVGPFQSGSVRNEIARSTNGNAGVTKTLIPVQVAFQPPAPEALAETPPEQPATPPPASATQTVEFTSAQSPAMVPAAEAAPAADDGSSDAPGWAQ